MIAARPLVTVVTPSLNPGQRLARCIASVASQGVPVEHIVADGGSSDGTVELLDSLPDVRWWSEPDSGQANAINRGFATATADVVGWLGADDELRPEALHRVLAAFADPAVGWVHGGIEVHHDGRVVERRRGQATVTRRDLERGNPVPQPGSFLRRWALDRIGPLDERLHLAFDVDLWVRLVDAGIPGAHVPAVLARFEIHDESKTGRTSDADWIREEVALRLGRGWTRGAAFHIGRLAAHELGPGRLDRDALRSRVRALLDEHGIDGPALVDVGVGAALVEAVRVDGGWRGLRHLAHGEVWRDRDVLRSGAERSVAAARRLARRVVTR